MNKVVKKIPVKVFCPNYRLAPKYKYPTALNDCYSILEYMYDNSKELGIDKNKIIVGGESAGGGLCLAVCLLARDKGKIKIKYQFPLYPMIDCNDTESSKNNKGYIWNTKKNHKAWKKYLGENYYFKKIDYYASPARLRDYSNIPPIYTFVGDGEPFYSETIKLIENAKHSKVEANIKIFHTKVHAFDMLFPFSKKSKEARKPIFEIISRIGEKNE